MGLLEILLPLALLAALLGGALAWRRALRRHPQPATLRRPARRPRPPTFRWQAALILLPVVALSGLGFLATYRDYALTEQEARQRASELAAELARTLGGAVAGELLELELWGSVWAGAGIIGGDVPWPDASPLAPSEQNAYRARLDQWQAANPAYRPEDVLPVGVQLTPEGHLEWPRPAGLPQPAAWRQHLSEEQADLWLAAAQADDWAANPETARAPIEAFLETGVEGPARANAEFIQLLATLPPKPPAARVEALLDFGQRHGDIEAESGLPLPTLALARALQEAADRGLNRRLFEALARQIRSLPSLLTPRLLEDAAAVAAQQGPKVQQAVSDLQARWRSQDRLRELGRRTMASLHPSGVSPTSLWLEHVGERWFAIVGSGVLPSSQPNPDPENARSGGPTGIRFFPKALLRQAVDRAVARTRLTLPPYLQLEITLEREPLHALAGDTASARSPRFATATARVSPLGAFPAAHHPLEDPQAGERFEAWPGHPQLALALSLRDPARLYARARQRAAIFATVVLAGLATALAGLFAAHRAFRRQLHLNEMKSNFVSSVSHELRAPIASVRLLAENLDRGKVTDEAKRREYYRLIGQECRRLSALIENVLDFARMDQGRKHYEFAPTDLPALVTQTVQLLEPYAAERQVTLRSRLPSPFPLQPSLDGQALQQALVNLIDNAVKHSPAGAAIQVTLALSEAPPPVPNSVPPGTKFRRPAGPDRPPVVHLSVADEGPGIPPAEHARIFEPFYRLGSELRRETPGVGIGLSIVHHVVAAHAGRVWVESQPGQGCRVVIELPANEAPSGAEL